MNNLDGKQAQNLNSAVMTLRGTFWRYLSHISGKLVIFIATVILARLLSREDFGVASYAIVVIGFLDVLSDLGIGSSVILFKKGTSRSNTAFWLNIVVGLGLYGLTWLIAPVAGILFQDNRAIDVIRMLGLVFPLNALSNIHDSLLQKEVAFGRKMVPDLVRSVSKGAISIVLAFWGFGAWSLIYGQVFGTAVSAFVYWWIHPFRPTLTFEKRFVRPLLGYGLGMVGVNAIGIAILNLDYVFIGRYLGPIALGVYSLAFRVPELVIRQFCGVVGQVLFAVYARMRENRGALRQGFLVTMRYVTLVTFPMSIGLALLSRPFVLTVFSAKWAEAIPVIPAISIYMMIRSLTFNIGDVYKVQKRLGTLNKISLVQLAVLIPSLYWAVTRFQSIAMVAWMQVVAVSVGGAIRFSIATRLLKTPFRSFVDAVGPAACSTAVMALGVALVLEFLSVSSPLLQLIAGSVAGAVLYMVALWFIKRDVIRSALEVLRAAWFPTKRNCTSPHIMIQADLRFLLPLQAGDRIAILGEAPDLTEALRREPVHVRSFLSRADENFPLLDGSMDHVLVPSLNVSGKDQMIREIARILRPGGWLVLGIRNSSSLQHRAFWRYSNGNGFAYLTSRNCEKMLEASGFAIAKWYGVRRNPGQPRFLVPLDSPTATDFYFQHISFPNSRSAAMAYQLGAFVAPSRFQRLIFTDMAVLAQKPPQEN